MKDKLKIKNGISRGYSGECSGNEFGATASAEAGGFGLAPMSSRAAWFVSLGIGFLLLDCGALHAQQAPTSNEAIASNEEEDDTGEDITRPRAGADLRYRYSHVQSANHDNNLVRLRGELPVTLDDSWKLALRLYLPLRYTNVTGSDNPAGQYQFGMGDLMTELIVLKALNARWAVGTGVRLAFPTASEAEMGTGKYRAMPEVGARYLWPEISPGSFALGLMRYNFDYAGDSQRRHISVLQFEPQLNISLPETWFVALYPSPDIRVNLGHKRPGDSGYLFLPFDAMVGKIIGKGLVTSLEIAFPIVNDYKVYDYKIEARFGLKF
jgi:hypothetical protein